MNPKDPRVASPADQPRPPNLNRLALVPVPTGGYVWCVSDSNRKKSSPMADDGKKLDDAVSAVLAAKMERVSLAPGDLLILSFPINSDVTDQTIRRVREELGKLVQHLGAPKAQGVVLHPGVSMGVVKKHDLSDINKRLDALEKANG